MPLAPRQHLKDEDEARQTRDAGEKDQRARQPVLGAGALGQEGPGRRRRVEPAKRARRPGRADQPALVGVARHQRRDQRGQFGGHRHEARLGPDGPAEGDGQRRGEPDHQTLAQMIDRQGGGGLELLAEALGRRRRPARQPGLDPAQKGDQRPAEHDGAEHRQGAVRCRLAAPDRVRQRLHGAEHDRRHAARDRTVPPGEKRPPQGHGVVLRKVMMRSATALTSATKSPIPTSMNPMVKSFPASVRGAKSP